jgi:ABC-2 type transport system ATP-binding protein
VKEAPALEAMSLGKQYGSLWGLRDCTLEVPAGSVIALVGPNGSGKTTLLHLAIGLTRPSAGDVRVFGRDPRSEAAAVLPAVGFVAQDHPLFAGLTVAETLKLGRRLNPTWDGDAARARVEQLGLPLRKKVGRLSGGQRAQVALTLGLAKRPELLLLDEPIVSLDPLARHEFLSSLMESAASGLTVVLSSHVVSDLQRVCDHLVILGGGRIQLAGPIDEILAAHRLLIGPRGEAGAIARVHEVISESHSERQTTLLVRANSHAYDARWQLHELDLEQIVRAYLAQRRAPREERLAS